MHRPRATGREGLSTARATLADGRRSNVNRWHRRGLASRLPFQTTRHRSLVFGEARALLFDHLAFALDRLRYALKVAVLERTLSRFMGGIEVGLQCPGHRVSEFWVRPLHAMNRREGVEIDRDGGIQPTARCALQSNTEQRRSVYGRVSSNLVRNFAIG